MKDKEYGRLRKKLTHSKELSKALKVLRVLSNPTRLKIAFLLLDGELCVCELEKILKKEHTLISHHMKQFKDLRLVKKRREGRWRYYSLRDEKLKEFLMALS